MPTISQHEIERRKAMAHAKSDLTAVMAKHELTAMEWADVLNELSRRMLAHGLREEWHDPA